MDPASIVPVILLCSMPIIRHEAPDFMPVERILEEAVRDRAFPGCVVALGSEAGVLWKRAVGCLEYDGKAAVTSRTLYDLASLTKVVGTTSVVLCLVRDGRLALDEPVSRTVPEFAGEGRERILVEHLLTHTSGLPAWSPLFREATGYAAVLQRVLETVPENPPGEKTVYSDLGFILLGEVAARAGGKPLAELEQELVFRPLGLETTTRAPTERAGLDRIAPTETVTEGPGIPASARTGEPVTIRGVVHDENSRATQGLTGHAGLFSTAEDLGILAAELLRGLDGKSRLFPKELLETFVTPRGIVAGSSRALGWDTPTRGSSAGKLLGPRAFGHTGFTGTSIWIDPDRDLFVILLTNRVHPTRENLKILEVRRRVADAAVLCTESRLRSF